MTANNKIVLVACTIVCILLALGVPTVNAFVDNRGKPFVVSKTTRIDNNPLLLNVRGGDATSLEVEESDAEDFEIESSDEEYDDDDEEEESEDELDPKLAKSAQSSATKVRAKATAAAKAAVNTKLEKTAPVLTKKKKSSSSGLLKLFHIPYIVKALFNPFTFMQMTKGYWASLFNLNYLDENKDSSQDLRSALEAKAKKGGSSTGGTRGKRKMKPGQAKTLSDLPQLNT